MKNTFRAIILSFAVSTIASFAAAESTVTQSARRVPVAHEVDLLVLGGSTGGVAAACEAAVQGAKVLLVTPYPYLGEDRTATLRLDGEAGEDGDDPLSVTLNRDEKRDGNLAAVMAAQFRQTDKLPFTYAVDGKIDRSHPEIEAPGRLADGKFGDPVTDSLQINGDAVITVDLGETKEVRQLFLMAYRRPLGDNPFDVEKVELIPDGTNVPLVFHSETLKGISRDADLAIFSLLLDKPVTTRSLKLNVKKPDTMKRILLAQLVVFQRPFVPESAKETGESRPPRPMHIKRVLDQALLDAGVPFLFNTFHVGEIRDDKGSCFGAVIANRGGRQAILAKKVLDTRRRDSSLKTAEFVVIGANPVTPDLARYPLLKTVSHEFAGEPFIAAPRSTSDPALACVYPIVRYRFEVDVPNDAKTNDIALRAEIEKQIRLATYSPDQSFTADEIDYPHEFHPLSYWRVKGRELGEEAKKTGIPAVERLTVASEVAASNGVIGDVKEILGGLRSEVLGFEGKSQTVNDPRRHLPVLGKYDVVVVGGGTSGAPAGIAAGRQGARTLVLEHLHDLGGIGTAGAISVYWYGNVTGFTKEVQDGLRRWTIESKIHWWRSKLAEAGTDVWYGVLAGGALVEGDRVKGVLVATPFGPGIVEADIVIDATGNGDIAIAAGAAVQSYDDREIAVQGAGLAPRNLGASYTNTDFMFVDDSDVIDSSHVFVYAKEKYPNAFDQGKLLSTRERRQILGEFSFTVLDQINNRTYPDTLVNAYSDYDTHGYTIDPYMELNHPYRTVKKADGKWDRTDRLFAYVPYRSSIPKGLDGILVVGLAMSSHRDALPVVRMQPDLQNQGYAVGCAAAMLAKSPGTNVRNLDVRTLQKHLVGTGNLEPEVVTHEDNYGKTKDRLPAAVDSLPEHFRESVPLVMWYPDEARPLVHDAYVKENDFERKLVYAKVAAGLGDPVGVPTILKKLGSYDNWDKGWEFTGMGQAGAATSPIDQWIMMLGRTGDPRAVDEIVKKAKLLTPKSEFSHFRAVALALEGLRSQKAAKALSDLLDMPGMTGYVHDTIEKASRFDDLGGRTNTNQEKARRDSLIEISLARALYRCGDVDGRGEAILRAYTKDLRGYFARHAREVLKDK